ncbi:MAG: DUF4139 domain-containing protein [Tuberibacillus sp.]
MKAVSTQKDTQDLSITIYNNGFGVVKERRALNLMPEADQVQYVDVAEKIEIDSIIVKGLHILEMNYDYDLVNKEKLLEKYLDRHVWIVNKENQSRTEYRLLSVSSGMVLENVETKEIAINPQGELILPSLPDGLIVKPALIWKIKPSETQSVDVSYLTKGLSWTSNYVINLEKDHLKLSGWVNIFNHSGAGFENVQIKLIAGDVRRVDEIRDYDSNGLMIYSSQPELEFEEKSFADYHMYTLQRRTSLKQNQSKQINFIELDQIAYRKYYTAERWSENVRIFVEFHNTKDNGMGIPLPEGVIKVYQEDEKDNHLEFIGEDSIGHTPKDEKVRLSLGEAFDIKCSGNKVNSYRSGRYLYESYRYTVRNHKDEAIHIKIPHHISGEWEMLEHSEPFEYEDYNDIVFWVDVPPNTNKAIDMTYRIDNGITVEVHKNEQ